jgi:hypothetical protein
MTTPATLSSDYAADPTPIEQLRIEAGFSGDADMIALCNLALQDERGQCDEDRSAIAFARAKCERLVAAARRSDMLSFLRSLDDGTGDLGIIIDQALADDPAVTIAAVREIVLEARAEARQS